MRERLATRGTEIDWDEFVYLDQQRRDALARIEKLKERKNRLSGEIGKVKKSGGDATALMGEVEEVAEMIREGEKPLPEIESRFERSVNIPNLPDPSVPVGGSAAKNRSPPLGDTPQFDFAPKNHWDIGEELGILDFARAAEIAGARFALYMDAGARLERVLINFMLDLHTQRHGYREVLPPFLVNRDAMTGTGQLPKLEEDLFRVSEPDFFLIPTAEVPVTNIHREEMLEREQLPIRYVAYALFSARSGLLWARCSRPSGNINSTRWSWSNLPSPSTLTTRVGKIGYRCRDCVTAAPVTLSRG